MIKVNIHEAKTHLSPYVEKAVQGEVVLLCKRSEPVAELRALPKARTGKRPIGLGKGLIKIPDTFFDPLPEEVLRAFEGESDS
jgi:antitoxin (DNA-binding transcriptional repressor) of toxin-antitoxin stability system